VHRAKRPEQSAKGIAQNAIVIRGSTLCAMPSIGRVLSDVFRIPTLMNPMYLLKLASDVKNFLARLKNPKVAGKYFERKLFWWFPWSKIAEKASRTSRNKKYSLLSTSFHKYGNVLFNEAVMKFDLTTESQRTQRRNFFLPGDDGKRKTSMLWQKDNLRSEKIILGSPKVQIFFDHRRLPMGKKIKILCVLRVSVVKKYTANT
jgi:hypothetical protein